MVWWVQKWPTDCWSWVIWSCRIRARSKRHAYGKTVYLHCVISSGIAELPTGRMWFSVTWGLRSDPPCEYCDRSGVYDCLGTRKTEFPPADVTWKVVAVRDNDKWWSSRGNTICTAWILEEPSWDCSKITLQQSVSLRASHLMRILEMAQGSAAWSTQHNPAWGTMRGAALEGIVKEPCRHIQSDPLKQTLDSKTLKHSYIIHRSTHIHPGHILPILLPNSN